MRRSLLVLTFLLLVLGASQLSLPVDVAHAQSGSYESSPAPDPDGGPLDGTIEIALIGDINTVVTRQLAITNTGATPLNITGYLPATGYTLAEVGAQDPLTIEVGNPIVVAPGGNRTLEIRCTPTELTGNPANAQLRIFHSDTVVPPNPAGEARYDLSCSGRSPNYNDGSPDPMTYFNFSNVPVGAVSVPINLNISNPNTGTAQYSTTLPLEGTVSIGPGNQNAFVFSDDPDGSKTRNFSLSEGGFQSFPVACRPGAAGNNFATLTVTHNAKLGPPSPRVYELSCNGTVPIFNSSVTVSGAPNPTGIVGIPSGTTNPPPLLIGATTNNSRPIAITNTGDATLSISVTTPPSTPFSYVVVPTFAPLNNIPPGDEARIRITCSPTQFGLQTSTLVLDTNDNTNADTVTYTLNCIGAAPTYVPVTPSTTGATVTITPSVLVGNTSAPGTITFGNATDEPLDLSNPVLGGTNPSEFAVTTAFPIEDVTATGGNAIIEFTCTPTAPGTRSATLTFNTNDPALPSVNYTLQCTGIQPGFSSVPAPNSTFNFGNVQVGSASNQPLELRNSGGAALNITNITITPGGGAFRIAGGNPGSVTIAAPISPATVRPRRSRCVANRLWSGRSMAR
ncbi:MAG: choice-of-anchor D domain-containing protein [Anaerolineae bacterium]|nr:choice-of-anchor D domain-containing protein [Anaerolineae bacterium]